jgi:D-glycero-D-manno-heptose 1,7-bisphosphate phosphatase
MNQKILFVDLDGTIRVPKSGSKFIQNPDDQSLIPGVAPAIAKFSNYEIIGITNQGGVAAGYKSLEDCISEQMRTMELLPAIKEINFCIDFAGKTAYRLTNQKSLILLPEGPNYRKPGPGLLLAYLELFPLFPDYAIMVGDREEDRQAAYAAGIDFMWAEIFLKNYS